MIRVDADCVRAGVQEGHSVISRVVAPAGRHYSLVAGSEVAGEAYRVGRVLDGSRRRSVAARHLPRDRSGCRRVDRTEVGYEREVLVPVKGVQEAPADVEIDHDVGACRRHVEGMLHEGVQLHLARSRMVLPIHEGRVATAPPDGRQARIDRHPDRLILAGRQLPFAHEGRGALLQPEQIEGLSRLGDEYPVAASARVQLRARFDADDIYVHARDRVIPERRVRSRDTGAYAALVARYRDRLGRYAVHMLGNREDAEEALQDAFVRGYRSLARCDDPERFGAWLYGILVNRCRTTGARAARRGQVFVRDEAALNGAPLPSSVERTELDDVVRRALARLAPEYREAFLLKHMDDLEYEEMARLTGAGVSALKMRVKRAREQLQAILREVERV